MADFVILPAAQLPIASAICDEPMTGAELGALDGISTDSVYTVLARMQAKGLAEQDRDKRWSLTKIGKRALYTTREAGKAWRASGFRLL